MAARVRPCCLADSILVRGGLGKCSTRPAGFILLQFAIQRSLPDPQGLRCHDLIAVHLSKRLKNNLLIELTKRNHPLGFFKPNTAMFLAPGFHLAEGKMSRACPLHRRKDNSLSKPKELLCWLRYRTTTLVFRRCSIHCVNDDDFQWNGRPLKLKAKLLTHSREYLG